MFLEFISTINIFIKTFNNEVRKFIFFLFFSYKGHPETAHIIEQCYVTKNRYIYIYIYF